jgi:hypothetical protein
LLLEGIDLSKGQRRKRYCLPAAALEGEESEERTALMAPKQ